MGQAKDYGHYKQWVGEITGFRLSIAEINTLLQQGEVDDDDLEE